MPPLTLYLWSHCMFVQIRYFFFFVCPKCTDWNSWFLPLGDSFFGNILASVLSVSKICAQIQKRLLRWSGQTHAILRTFCQHITERAICKYLWALLSLPLYVLLWCACCFSVVSISFSFISSGCLSESSFMHSPILLHIAAKLRFFVAHMHVWCYCVLLLIIGHPHSARLHVLWSVAQMKDQVLSKWALSPLNGEAIWWYSEQT